VEDSGIGIAPQDQSRVFDPFSQAEAGEKRGEGTGLGLAISREFVRLIGGQLNVDSRLGKGSVFRFSIPLSAADRVPRKIANRRVVGLAPGQPLYRMLVVEDNRDNRRLWRQLMERIGFEVREAENGQEAIDVSCQWHPHVIWMDMRMPVMDGFEATRRIKAIEGAATTIIALTASAFEQDKEAALKAGCDDFVRKPVSEADLCAALHQHLGVCFVYEELAPKGQKTAVALDMRELPAELRGRLERAAVVLDVEQLYRLVEQVRALSPLQATALERIIEGYRFDEITRAARAED
jgi:CheY-like chemotaxis protein